jgi:hypothetical protein
MTNGNTLPQFHKILSHSIPKKDSVNEKRLLKRFLPRFGEIREFCGTRKISPEHSRTARILGESSDRQAKNASDSRAGKAVVPRCRLPCRSVTVNGFPFGVF